MSTGSSSAKFMAQPEIELPIGTLVYSRSADHRDLALVYERQSRQASI
jgi:hypothetical protein